MEVLIRCSRFGRLYKDGDALEDRARVLIVLNSERKETEKWRDPTRCPRECCGEWLEIAVRPATADEAAAYRKEEAEKLARLIAYRAKVAAYHATRTPR